MMRNRYSYHLLSLVLHAVLFGIGGLLTYKIQEDMDQTSIAKKMRVVGKSIKVDIVAMPRMTIQELQNAEPAAGKVEPVKVEKVKDTGGDENTVFEKKVKKPSFSDMLKKFSKRNVKKAKVKKFAKKKVDDSQQGAGGIKGKSLKKILALGNRISEGSALTGSGSGENTNDTFDKYAIKVMESVKENWRLPGYLANKDLSCHVQVFIGRNGRLLNTKVVKSSGNSDYDQRAIASVKKTTTFPYPDETIQTRVGTGEIVLAFPL
jgi:colicin import membrane protein